MKRTGRVVRLISLAIGLGVLLSGCWVNVNVRVFMNENLTGEVVVSTDFSEELQSPESVISPQGLEDADWVVLAESDSSIREDDLSIRKDFVSSGHLHQILREELPLGFHDVFIEFIDEGDVVNYTFRGKISPSDDMSLEDLLLDGYSAQEIDAFLEASSVTFSAELPGDVVDSSGVVEVSGDEVVNFSYASSDSGSATTRIWGWVSWAAFALFGFAVLLNGVGYLVERRQRQQTQLQKTLSFKFLGSSAGFPSAPPAPASPVPTRLTAGFLTPFSLHPPLTPSQPRARASLRTSAGYRIRLILLDTALLLDTVSSSSDASSSDASISDASISDILPVLQELARGDTDLRFFGKHTPDSLVQLDGPARQDALAKLDALAQLATFAPTATLDDFENLRWQSGVPYRHWVMASPDSAMLQVAHTLGIDIHQITTAKELENLGSIAFRPESAQPNRKDASMSKINEFNLPSGTSAVSCLVENPKRALVIIPDVLGLRPLYHDHTLRLATENQWNVCTYELFALTPHMEREERFATASNLSDERILGDAIDAAKHLTADQGLDIPVGIIGFCMGGMYTTKSTSTGRFDRAVSFYGMIHLPDDWKSDTQGEPLDHLAKGDASSLLAIIAGDDPWTPQEHIDDLRNAGVHIDTYDGCDHAFVHDPTKETYVENQAIRAWEATIKFLNGETP